MVPLASRMHARVVSRIFRKSDYTIRIYRRRQCRITAWRCRKPIVRHGIVSIQIRKHNRSMIKLRMRHAHRYFPSDTSLQNIYIHACNFIPLRCQQSGSRKDPCRSFLLIKKNSLISNTVFARYHAKCEFYCNTIARETTAHECRDIRRNIHCDRRLICNFAGTAVYDENPSCTQQEFYSTVFLFLEAADVIGTEASRTYRPSMHQLIEVNYSAGGGQLIHVIIMCHLHKEFP